jgi:hypothetical protein
MGGRVSESERGLRTWSDRYLLLSRLISRVLRYMDSRSWRDPSGFAVAFRHCPLNGYLRLTRRPTVVERESEPFVPVTVSV